MPLTGSVKNQITGQIDAVWDAIAAGTALENLEWIHQAIFFTAGGFKYGVVVMPEGTLGNEMVVVKIKRNSL